MAGVIDLTTVVQAEIADYVRPSPNSIAYYLENKRDNIYAVVAVPQTSGEKPAVLLLARIDDGRIIIETDITNKPLAEALQQAGIPAEQIVLAYESK